MSGKLTLISSATASGSSSVEFTSGIDSTYDEYVIFVVNCRPDNDGTLLQLKSSTDGGSSWGVTTTNTFFMAEHNESGSGASLAYQTSLDVAQSSSYPPYAHLTQGIGSDADQCASGEVHIFSPSSTTKVKHFYSKFSTTHNADRMVNDFMAGYWNTTSAINALALHGAGPLNGNFYLFGVS